MRAHGGEGGARGRTAADGVREASDAAGHRLNVGDRGPELSKARRLQELLQDDDLRQRLKLELADADANMDGGQERREGGRGERVQSELLCALLQLARDTLHGARTTWSFSKDRYRVKSLAGSCMSALTRILAIVSMLVCVGLNW